MPHTVSEIQNVLVMLGHGAQVQFSLGSDVDIMVFQVPTPLHSGDV